MIYYLIFCVVTAIVFFFRVELPVVLAVQKYIDIPQAWILHIVNILAVLIFAPVFFFITVFIPEDYMSNYEDILFKRYGG